MAPARRKASGGRIDVKALLTPLLKSAVAALNDPATRERLIAQGRSISDLARRWRSERERKRVGAAGNDMSKIGGLGFFGRFGQRGLKRRAARTRAAIAELIEHEPALGAELHPVVELLDGIDRSLIAAAALPTFKRMRACREIDEVLDQVEKSIFDAALASSSTTGSDSPEQAGDESQGA